MIAGERIRALRRARNITQAELARLIGTSAPHISRIETGGQRPEQGTLERIARALEVSPAVLKDGHRTIEPWHDPHPISLDNLLAAKCIADFANSALASYAHVIQAADLYRARIAAYAHSKPYRHVAEAMGELTAVNWVADRLDAGAGNGHIVRAITELERFTHARGRALRIGCGILPGPIATVLAIQADLQTRYPDRVILTLDTNHACGVELVSAAVEQMRGDAFDFLVAPTGAANLTMAGIRNCRHYRPLFPIHFTRQVCLTRLSSTGRNPDTKQLMVYAASSGLEEALVRRHELALKDDNIVEHEMFTSLVELLARLDDGQAVNAWDPLAAYLERRFGWCCAIARPYLSQNCLYQRTSLDRTSSVDAADAFKTLFSTTGSDWPGTLARLWGICSTISR